VSRARPGVLRVGDRVCLESVVRTVVGFVGTTVLLADEHGSVITPDFSLVCSRAPARAPRSQADAELIRVIHDDHQLAGPTEKPRRRHRRIVEARRLAAVTYRRDIRPALQDRRIAGV
jgi:hypothetical protein